MSSVEHTAARGRLRRRAGGRARLIVPIAIVMLLGCFAAAFVIHALWSRWPNYRAAPDAPEIPISVAGVVFNVPPGAVRNRVQRRAGTHERVDLAFLWPSLVAPTPGATSASNAQTAGDGLSVASTDDRIFITISAAGDSLSPAERLQTIYPRYAESMASAGPDGLAVLAFRQGTPYQGEDLVYDPSAPAEFLVRCTRRVGPTPGTCISERRIGAAALTLRFPRDWLDDWRSVAAGTDLLISRMRPTGG